ncbi:hypothetical protein B484DRAFT_392451, partial [Ochromonadaceae sp. CCMP2298]
FANRAKNIRNEARVNEDLDQKSLLRKYERELRQLRAELAERSRSVVDQRRLLELEEQRRRAEADKMVAIRALEARSDEFEREKEEKRRLEERIFMLQGQGMGHGQGQQQGHGLERLDSRVEMSTGGRGVGGGTGGGMQGLSQGADLDLLMQEQRERLSQEYSCKLADLERERVSIEEEKAQVDRYKLLLLKQRDIMIALTQRLVERDEQIKGLQEEVEGLEVVTRELEERLDAKTARLIRVQVQQVQGQG